MSLAAFLGLIILTIVGRLARRDQLSFRYAAGWAVIALVGILGGISIPVVSPIASVLGLSGVALLAIVVTVVLVLIAIQLSISISGLQKQIQDLTEEIGYQGLKQEESSRRHEP